MRKPILTDRLVLGDIDVADAESLFNLDADPEVMRYIGPRPASDVTYYRDRIRTTYVRWQAHPWHGIRIVRDRKTTAFLGWVFIRPATDHLFAGELGWARPDEVEVGFRFCPAAWGRGIATEASARLVEMALADAATAAVVGCARVDNVRSLRVLEKLGLERVG
jgi:RimJ/RimL family protein N-acetyltransferase